LSRSLNIAIVTSELPYPPTSGNRIRTLNLAIRLAHRHRITFIAHRNDEVAEATRFLRGHGIQTVLVDRFFPLRSGLGFYARLLGNLASPLPYSVASHSSQALRRAVRLLATEQRIDIWQSEATALIDTLDDLNGVPKVVVAHNVESLIWQRYCETEPNALKGWYIKQQWRKFERFERGAFGTATRVVAVSAEDGRLIRDRFGGRRVVVVDNGIDRAYFEAVQPDPDPGTILFLGSFDWRPNLDAVDRLLDRIFPAVLRAEPSARLWLVGRRPPDALVRRVQGLAGVELHADVPDVRPFLARSGVMVVPLRIGGGSRLKILEALAAGLPVISTRVGAEGLELVPGQDFIAADDAESMSHELLAHLRDPSRNLAMAQRSRQFVLDRYDWDFLAGKLEAIWLECAEDSWASPSDYPVSPPSQSPRQIGQAAWFRRSAASGIDPS
jgi:glycosyltransferase involved in cell wall biosynthesis